MPSIGVGVREIRISTQREHRVIYVVSFAEAIYVLHAFEKKSRKTSTRDVKVAKARFKMLRRTRAGV